MREVVGKVAVVTGGVSGIGLGIAKALAHAGMKVAVTYRRDDHREQAMEYFRARPELIVRPIRLDVTDRAAVAAAAEEIERAFGKIHVLCNNAGVNIIGAMEDATYEDWDWVLGVNLFGVINTLTSFVPKIRAHGEGGHVVNVASMSSFISGPGVGVYTTSKFAVRGLSECLRYNLARYKIGVSLACPGLTQSKIYEAQLRRPPHLARTAFPVDRASLRQMEAIHSAGMDPLAVGRRILQAIRKNEFYVFSHPEFKEEVRELCERILAAFTDESPDPKRLVFEEMRRRTKSDAEKAVAALAECE